MKLRTLLIGYISIILLWGINNIISGSIIRSKLLDLLNYPLMLAWKVGTIILVIWFVRWQYQQMQQHKFQRYRKLYFTYCLMLSFVAGMDLLLYSKYKISFVGYWSDCVLFWLWLLSTCFLLQLFWKQLWAKIYGGILVLALILSMLPMGIIFFGIILSTTGSGLQYKKQITKDYRFQITNYSVMGRPVACIVINKGLFEQEFPNTMGNFNITDSTDVDARDIKSVTYLNENEDSIALKAVTRDTVSYKVYFYKKNEKE
ncbi:hypothetical protein LZQ00_03040 [Sphingobacterium sp. SRCM116780]|uniref:hypothetical protein n=1 Tax=Sphingobacterium sp. SRCM116780 TaxID=2907623 RepID=UPI001F1BF572|nr:hypothetical protein [Sphingobacterium sp. SRCM116780]UIR56800.1 hypothetical protein LZQ00_03040 [Sphingobacterium sp. SRCM116780]